MVGGAWNYSITNGTGPYSTQGCNPIAADGCAVGWLNLFFIRDNRGDVPVGFSDPTPFAEDSSHFPTPDAALAAAEWHQFDVAPNLFPNSPEPTVTFYIYDTDYTDNLGSLTLDVYSGIPPFPPGVADPPNSAAIPEPPGWALLGTAFIGLLLGGRFRERRELSSRRLG